MPEEIKQIDIQKNILSIVTSDDFDIRKNHPEYNAAMLQWQYAMDLRGGDPVLKAKAPQYLPLTNRLEGRKEYAKRVEHSYSIDYFNNGIDSIARSLFQDDLEVNVHPELQNLEVNSDRKNNSITQFGEMTTVEGFYYGVYHILTLLSPVDGQPFFQHIPPHKLYNWYELDGKVIYYAVLNRETKDYKLVTVYGAEGWYAFKIEDKDVKVLSMGTYYEGQIDPLPDGPPIKSGFFKMRGSVTGLSPFQTVCRMNLRHFRVLNEFEGYTSQSLGRVLTFTGVNREQVRENNAPGVDISSNTIDPWVGERRGYPRDVMIFEEKDSKMDWITPNSDGVSTGLESLEYYEDRIAKFLAKYEVKRIPSTASEEMLTQFEQNIDNLRYATEFVDTIKRAYLDAAHELQLGLTLDDMDIMLNPSFLELFNTNRLDSGVNDAA